MSSLTTIDQSASKLDYLRQDYPPALTNLTNGYIKPQNHFYHKGKIWDYFKPSSGDRNKAMCLLCSQELCHNSTTATTKLTSSHNNSIKHNDHKDQMSTTDKNNNDILWDHLRTKHSIDKQENDPLSNPMIVSNELTDDCQVVTPITKDSTIDIPTHKKTLPNDIDVHSKSSKHKIISRNQNQTIMTSSKAHHQNHKHNHRSSSSSTTDLVANTKRSEEKKSTTNRNDKLRRSLDMMDYNDFTLTSMKPSASSTGQSNIPRNLMSRLNELSEPVARKLKFWNKKSFQVNQYDPSFKVIYLGNLGMQFLSKDELCLEKPLNTLWNNYLVYMKTEIVMRLTICNSGLKAITRQHGLTQYWSNRLVYCFTHKNYPKIFSWIYRHEGKKMRQELRCHAVFCSSPDKAQKMVSLLNQRLACALQEFKREKKSRELPSIMTKGDTLIRKNSQSIQLLQQTLPRTVPLRRQILAKGSANFRPPLDRSKSAPKLTAIREEDYDECYSDSASSSSSSLEEDSQHDEFEFEQSFGEKDDDEIESVGPYDREEELEIERFVENLRKLELESASTGAREKIESDSLITSAHETTTATTTSNNSSVRCATGDNPCDNQSTSLDHEVNDNGHQHDLSNRTTNGDVKTSLNRVKRFDRSSFCRLSRRSSRNSTTSRLAARTLDSSTKTEPNVTMICQPNKCSQESTPSEFDKTIVTQNPGQLVSQSDYERLATERECHTTTNITTLIEGPVLRADENQVDLTSANSDCETKDGLCSLRESPITEHDEKERKHQDIQEGVCSPSQRSKTDEGQEDNEETTADRVLI